MTSLAEKAVALSLHWDGLTRGRATGNTCTRSRMSAKPADADKRASSLG